MVTGCVIRKCSSVWSPISYTSYHCFPLKNEKMMEKWMKAIPPGYITIPKHSSRICSRHFLNNCFVYSPTGKRTLKKDAVPTLFGSEARKEDILSLNKIKKERDSNGSEISSDEEQQSFRYIKKSKYLQQVVPASENSNPTILIQKAKKPKISDKEIELKKKIIMLKIKQLRRENRIQSMTTVVNTYKTIVFKSEDDDN